MTIENCPKCGGTHFGSHECPYIDAPCVVCGERTVLACSDCAIDASESIHVCGNRRCREQHESKVHLQLAENSNG
jgi:hypothetical protein